jgi:molecular chaperone DnaJ
MINHYKTLGLSNAASASEIRRAYRVLARRYHPDVNPNGDSSEIFKTIASAYAVLSDPEKKQQYDLELKQTQESFEESFERAREALKRNQRGDAYRKHSEYQSEPSKSTGASDAKGYSTQSSGVRVKSDISAVSDFLSKNTVKRIKSIQDSAVKSLKGSISRFSSYFPKRLAAARSRKGSEFALVELSISIQEAIQGARRTVNLAEPGERPRKVSVNIPAGVRTGSLVRLRGKESGSEIVLVINVENHPWLSLAERGLTMEIPLTFAEAVDGCKVQVPAFGDPLLVTVEPRTQSGKEVRLKGQGISLRDGTRGDLFIRFIVKVPDQELAPELKSLSELLGEAYSRGVREHLPKRIPE